MNKVIILVLVLSLGFNATNSNAAPVGSQFNYQGELINNGVPASGNYDITIKLFANEIGGSVIDSITSEDVPVFNGLFNIEKVDFGNVVYDGSQYFLEVSVQPSSGGSLETLFPRQRLNAVPYAVQAEFLATGGASNGDVLQFNGSDWVPAALGSSSPWNQSGITLTSPGKVGVGEPTPSAQLHITNNASQVSLLKVDDVAATRMVVQATGRIGVGTTSPEARLHIDSNVDEDPLRVQIDGATKFRLFKHGGVAIGTNFPNTPDNGLYVNGDVKQNSESNGMLKYMLRANCDTTPTIVREYNGTHVAGTATITRNSVGNCTISVPFDVTNNYISVSPIRAVSGDNRIASCVNLFSGMICQLSVGSTGADVNGDFDVLIY